MTKLDPRIAAVTDRIIERSRPTRRRYLDLMAEQAERGISRTIPGSEYTRRQTFGLPVETELELGNSLIRSQEGIETAVTSSCGDFAS